jgi:hypothetical protein
MQSMGGERWDGRMHGELMESMVRDGMAECIWCDDGMHGKRMHGERWQNAWGEMRIMR